MPDTDKTGPQTGPTKPGDEPDTDHRDHEDKLPKWNPEQDAGRPREGDHE